VNVGLAADGLTVARGGRVLFEALSFAAAPGEVVALTGRNGAGKTSLLRALAGLLRPSAGVVRFPGLADPEDAASALHLVGHQDGLKGARTVAEELRFWSCWFGGTGETADAALDRLDLRRLAALEVRRLSAGQRRRLALARLLAAPRPIWLLDEPMAPLDAGWRERFGEMLATHAAGGGVVVAAVHDPLPVPARAVVVGTS
jgi:heme exporter protein A